MTFYPPLSLISGRYEVASRPLLGGMGVVYLCYDHQEQRPVALKTFKPEYLPNRAARDRFLREGTTWVNLGKHPHIVRCYGVEYIGDGREVFLVLEQIAKEQGRQDASLRSWLTPGQPLPVEQALLIALQVVRGLKHVRERIPGFVHRDLKPENILVGADRLSGWSVNRVRVTDFGLATALSSLSPTALPDNPQSEIQNQQSTFSRTQLTHGLIGTPLYMAPEQWTGDDVSFQTDMYALGCILFETLNGQPAVEGQSPKDLELAHCKGGRPVWRTEVSPMIYSLINRCMERTQELRFANWNDLEQDLEEIIMEMSGQSVPILEGDDALNRDERIAHGWALHAIGLSYRDIGKTNMAKSYFEQAQTIGVADRVRRLEGATLGSLGNAYADLGEVQQAIKYLEQDLAIQRELDDQRGEGSVLINLGAVYLNLGDAQGAIGYLEQALTILNTFGDEAIKGPVFGNLGIAYKNLGDARQGLNYTEQHLAIARSIGDQQQETLALGNLGLMYKKLGDSRRAIGYYEQQFSVARAMAYRAGEGLALANLGGTYLELHEGQRATGYLGQALTIFREISSLHEEGKVLGNLGTAYLQLGDSREAIIYLMQALTIHNETNSQLAKCEVLGNLGQAYADSDDIAQAIRNYEQAISLAREIGNLDRVAIFSLNLALLYQKEADPKRAIPLAEEAARIFVQIGSPHTQNALRLMMQLGQKSATANPIDATNADSTTLTLAAIQGFLSSKSENEMLQLVTRYPFMTETKFFIMIEKGIQIPLELKPAFQQRLTWLRNLASHPKPSFFGRLFGRKG